MMGARNPSQPTGDDRGGIPDPERRFDVFLAFNSQDEPAAKRVRTIRAALKREGFKAWIADSDTPDNNLRYGMDSAVAMTKGISESNCFFCFFGEQGMGTFQSGFERLVANQLKVTEGRRVVPVLLPGAVDPGSLPLDLTISTSLDLRHAFEGDRLTEMGVVGVIAAVTDQDSEEVMEARAAQRVTTGRSCALVIGISTYTDPGLKELHGPRNDVPTLAAALREAGAPGGEWIITPSEDLDYNGLREAVKDFFAAADVDTALFYYSGHGIVDATDSYICATDSEVENPSFTAISAKQIAGLVKTCPARSKVVILDCCHAARLDDAAFDELTGNVAVVLASRGPAGDADVVSQSSPFTTNLIEVVRDPEAFGESTMTVGDVLVALGTRNQAASTNRECARDIVLAVRPGKSMSRPALSAPEFTVMVSAESINPDRMQLVRQLAATLDGLLAVARAESDVPSPLVNETIDLLARELAAMAPENEVSALQDQLDGAAADDPWPTCSLSFADEDAREKLRDLPWEYLSLSAGRRGKAPKPVAVQRVFPIVPTKQAVPAVPQRVALFRSSARAGDDSIQPFFTETDKQIDKLVKLDAPDSPTWAVFCSYREQADVVILQTPLRLDGDEVKVLFATPSPGELKPVPWTSVRDQLNDRRALTWLVIETVADGPANQSALAVRQLAQDLAFALERSVVGICHSRAYLRCFEENPGGTAFTAHLLWELNARRPLEAAAYTARTKVMSSLAIQDPAIVGIPIIVRPRAREPQDQQRPAPRRQ